MSHKDTDLFSPITLGQLSLKNRIVMAPMTRSRSDSSGVPSKIMADYYQQRSGAGLIIAEATQVSPQAIGYINTPGIYSDKQIESWKRVTDAVHQADGRIFLQLWHVGRVSHSLFHGGSLPVAPSAIAGIGEVFTTEGPKKMEIPRPLEVWEIAQIVEDFYKATLNAKQAGFDGVEIHGANGYLLDQFLRDGSNQRTDEYGGSFENRSRFVLEVTRAAISAWGNLQVGLRLSPSNFNNGMSDSNPKGIFGYLATKLNELNLSYLHVMEPYSHDSNDPNFISDVAGFFRSFYLGTLMGNHGFTFESANAALRAGKIDLLSYGVAYLANPDLPIRLRNRSSLNVPDRSTFYSGGIKGYLDYPFL